MRGGERPVKQASQKKWRMMAKRSCLVMSGKSDGESISPGQIDSCS